MIKTKNNIQRQVTNKPGTVINTFTQINSLKLYNSEVGHTAIPILTDQATQAQGVKDLTQGYPHRKRWCQHEYFAGTESPL